MGQSKPDEATLRARLASVNRQNRELAETVRLLAIQVAKAKDTIAGLNNQIQLYHQRVKLRN